ncbi:MAG: hypothetical protein FWE28_05685 [Oscillospiraceae bacterium]|nr:hypothetical protein [Oscillospiraceae bacterium]
MEQRNNILHMQKPIAILVMFAIALVLFSSHQAAATSPMPQLDPCCVDELVLLEELPCCEISEVAGCCFALYPPPMCTYCFVAATIDNAVCISLFHYRDCCNFIFEPPKA